MASNLTITAHYTFTFTIPAIFCPLRLQTPMEGCTNLAWKAKIHIEDVTAEMSNMGYSTY